MDQEQKALKRDKITISDEDKREHYLVEVYQSGLFPAATIREWRKKGDDDQTYTNAKKFFEAETRGLDEVQRLMGDAPAKHGFESAALALEKGLDGVLEKFNANVEERIQHAVDVGLQRIAATQQTNETANAASEVNMAKLEAKVEDLTQALHDVQKQIALLATATKGGGTNNDKGSDGSKYAWTPGLTLNKKWPANKRMWYIREVKKREPERAKKERKAFLEQQLKELE